MAEWQRLDAWLWYARFARTREACAGLAASGLLRINRQPTDKAHARLRPGDVLTLPLHSGIRVVRVLALAERRSSARAARTLYDEVPPPTACAAPQRPPYRPAHSTSPAGSQ